MLATTLETEANTYLAQHADQRDEDGRRLMVRNGFRAERTVAAAAVPVPLKQKQPTFYLYPYPAEHRIHLRTTNPIEPSVATIRPRTKVTLGTGTGTGTSAAALAMTFKPIESAQARRRRMYASRLVTLVRVGAVGPRVERGILVERDAAVAV